MVLGPTLISRRNKLVIGLGAVAVVLLIVCGGPATAVPTRSGNSTAIATQNSPPRQAVPETQVPTFTVAPTDTPLMPTSTAVGATPAATAQPAPAATPTDVPAATALAPPTATPTATVAPSAEIVLEIGTGSVARYLVKEQFARVKLPSDAMGETSDVSGMIVFDANGAVQRERSSIIVELRTLRSDDSDRDDFLETDALESLKFPFAELVVSAVPGLPWPLPTNSTVEFQLQGDMTLHGVTRPLTWDITAEFGSDSVNVSAVTNFTFGEFDMVKPSFFFLLSVEDNIRLELDLVASIHAAGDSGTAR